MIDINNIVNTAIQQEINKAITNYVDAYMADVQQEHRRQIAALREEIEQLKQQRADSPATGEGLAKDVVQDLLENNPAIKQAVYEIAHDAAEAVMADHLEGYDHDGYDSTVTTVEDLPDFDEFVAKDDLGDAVRESVRETLENRVSVSLYLS